MNRNLPTFEDAEARNKLSHFTVQGFDLNGVLHAGTNDGEEIYNYMRFGIDHILGFEPLRSAFQLCRQNTDRWTEELGYPGNIVLANYALDNYVGEAKLNVTAGDGKGSSLLAPNLDHPEVKQHWKDGQDTIVGQQTCAVITLPEWLRKHNKSVDIAQFDTLVLDTQGNEMQILEGMGALLEGFKYLCIELSVTPVYAGEHAGAEVVEYLKRAGFTWDSPELDHNDWFFVRSDIKPASDRVYRGKC